MPDILTTAGLASGSTSAALVTITPIEGGDPVVSASSFAAEAPIRREVRTDFVGEYVAYIFSDGHVETDPPRRPQSQEDVQRLRRKQYAAQQTQLAARGDQTKDGLPDTQRVRDASTLIGTLGMVEDFRQTQNALALLAKTQTAIPEYHQRLQQEADVGGEIVGDGRFSTPRLGPVVAGNTRPSRSQPTVTGEIR